MVFDPGLAVRFHSDGLRFEYGARVFGPRPEHRRLDTIRASLRDPGCEGPDPVYSIAMDVGRTEDLAQLQRRMLLFGVVAYAPGRLGCEPVRSQGHVHAVVPRCGWSTPEIFEVWEGQAIVYAQERVTDDPGRCVAIQAESGSQVVVPPGWAHCVINADPDLPMVFGAWCDRQYGFVYDDVRAHGGLAWFPLLDDQKAIYWVKNPCYAACSLAERRARAYPELGLSGSIPIYEEFTRNPEAVQWVSDPGRLSGLWPQFEP